LRAEAPFARLAAEAEQAMGRERSLAWWLSRVALAATSALLALGGAELVVRVLDLGPRIEVVFRDTVRVSDNPRLDYELLPGGRDGEQRISSAGLRDAETPFEKPPGTFRIVAIGDSITYGSGGPRALGWVEQLETLLGRLTRPGAPRFEVLNLGVPGYNVGQIAERLRSLGLRFEPDLVLYAYALNDPQSESIERDALRELKAETEAGRTRGAGPLGRWLSRSRLWLWARHEAGEHLVSRRRPERMPDDPAYQAAARGDRAAYFRTLHREPGPARRLEEGLTLLAGMARERAIPLRVALFPLFSNAGDEDPIRDVHALVAAAAQRHGLGVIDLAPVYARVRYELGRPLHLDFLHPNPLGHRVAAHALLDDLCTGNWLPPGAVDCAAAGAGDALDASLARIVAETPGDAPP
jgi:lysophospholipase L1-like esterase